MPGTDRSNLEVDAPQVGEPPDPLAGWDQADSSTRDAPGGGPPDGVLAAAATVAGFVAGGLAATSGRRGRGAALGAVIGLVGAAVARRMWVIEGPDATWTTTLGDPSSR